ncbi:MAG: site-2 protease family protein, partial [Candidatus Hermodarchaeota archaeon]|nr:site-2 protease family protein [Candidatus Hermodarchaeota archaeon]
MLQLEFLLPWLPWIIILLIWMVILGLASVYDLEKYRLEVGPFMLFWRTERFNHLLDRIGRWHPRAWRYIWSGFIGVAFFFSLYGFYYLILNAWEFIKAFLGVPGGTPGPVAPLIPGVTMSFQFFLMILIPLMVAIIMHELAHGIAARADDIPVKSSGIFAFLIFFGAFVEPDEDYVKIKSTRSQRARLFAAGSGVNVAIALVAIGLAALIVIQVPSGVLVQSIVPGSAADTGGLAPGMVITGMNGTAILTSEDLSLFMESALPGDLVIFTANGGSIPIVVGANPDNASRAYIGIYLSTYFPLHFPFSLLGPLGGIEFQRGLMWFIMITFSLGIINLLPIPPLDGDRLWKELIDATISLERTAGRVILWGLRVTAL